jgi:N-acetylmuramoyl-L-alanine amidase
MKVLRHRLHTDDGTAISFRDSPNRGGAVAHEYLVMHFTGGSSAESSIRWLTNRRARASAHVVIARDGTVTQLVPFDRVAWHAGPSEWEGRSGLNQYSLGIELDNAGPLQRAGGHWRAWFGTIYPREDVLEATHKHESSPRGWHLFPPAQIEAAADVAALLVEKYDLVDVIGHDDIAPDRKVDPGPAFPMSSFRARVMGRAGDEVPAFRTTTHLNIRSGPGTQHDRILDQPLPPGTNLTVLDTRASWRFVDVRDVVHDVMDLQGWVHGHYIERVATATPGVGTGTADGEQPVGT